MTAAAAAWRQSLSLALGACKSFHGAPPPSVPPCPSARSESPHTAVASKQMHCEGERAFHKSFCHGFAALDRENRDKSSQSKPQPLLDLCQSGTWNIEPGAVIAEASGIAASIDSFCILSSASQQGFPEPVAFPGSFVCLCTGFSLQHSLEGCNASYERRLCLCRPRHSVT